MTLAVPKETLRPTVRLLVRHTEERYRPLRIRDPEMTEWFTGTILPGLIQLAQDQEWDEFDKLASNLGSDQTGNITRGQRE